MLCHIPSPNSRLLGSIFLRNGKSMRFNWYKVSPRFAPRDVYFQGDAKGIRALHDVRNRVYYLIYCIIANLKQQFIMDGEEELCAFLESALFEYFLTSYHCEFHHVRFQALYREVDGGTFHFGMNIGNSGFKSAEKSASSRGCHEESVH